ncbi:hypothetical protein BDY24DRAFT_37423 [Mrakia frigida]|uniref:uncharacterized protein n=1 Tax=Mrakia frigida TaxID=29902 RepID=UPI003FCBEF2C
MVGDQRGGKGASSSRRGSDAIFESSSPLLPFPFFPQSTTNRNETCVLFYARDQPSSALPHPRPSSRPRPSQRAFERSQTSHLHFSFFFCRPPPCPSLSPKVQRRRAWEDLEPRWTSPPSLLLPSPLAFFYVVRSFHRKIASGWGDEEDEKGSEFLIDGILSRSKLLLKIPEGKRPWGSLDLEAISGEDPVRLGWRSCKARGCEVAWL